MKQVVLEYPDGLPGLLKLSEGEFALEMRFLLAAKLFELGKLSSGKAAEMAGCERIHFLERLAALGIPALRLDDVQIELELEAAAKLGG